MSDLETPQTRDIAATLATLARGFDLMPRLLGDVSNLTRWAAGSDLLAGDISEMVLAACEAELRSITAIRAIISVLRSVAEATPRSNTPMQALTDAEQELEIAQCRVNKALDQLIARLMPSEPSA